MGGDASVFLSENRNKSSFLGSLEDWVIKCLPHLFKCFIMNYYFLKFWLTRTCGSEIGFCVRKQKGLSRCGGTHLWYQGLLRRLEAGELQVQGPCLKINKNWVCSSVVEHYWGQPPIQQKMGEGYLNISNWFLKNIFNHGVL